MPTTDLTTTVNENALRLLKKVQMNVRQKVFLGPGNERLSKAEALARLKAMNPEQLASLVHGPQRDQFMDELEQLLAGGKHGR